MNAENTNPQPQSTQPQSTQPPSKLSSADAAAMAAGVAELTKAGLPLPAGLRALAEEMPRRRLKETLKEMAYRLERGDSLESVLESASENLPPHLYGLLLAGLRSGQLPAVMEEYLRMEEGHRKVRQRLRLSLAYPVFLAIFMAVIVCAFNESILSGFEKIFKDFGTALPMLTVVFFASAKYLQWAMIAFAVFMCFIPILASDAPGTGWLSPLVYRLPLLGTLLKYSRWSMFSKLAALMLEQKMPLPQAFRLIAAGLRDPYLSRACRRTADDVENGCRLSYSMQMNRWYPPSIIPFVAWGEKATVLPEAFSSAHELYEARAKNQTTSFMAIVVPLTFFMIVAFAVMTVLAIFMPLISLITSLTGGGYRYAMHSSPNATDWELIARNAFIGVVACFLVGVVLLIVKTVVFWARHLEKRHPLDFSLSVIGWSIIYLTTTVLLMYANLILGLLWLFVVPCFYVFIRFQNLRMRQQGLMWLMALASEKQIPMIPAIEAYASEVGGSYGDQVADFSALMINGIPLTDALHMVPGLVSAERYPLICSAYESGALAKGLREAAESRNFLQALWGSLTAKMMYIVGMILFGFSVLTFIMIKIIPAFEKIFKDFGQPLPSMTKVLINVSHSSLLLWPILALVELFFFLLFFHSLLKYLGVSVFELPGMGRFLRRKHTAEIMDNLAMAVENRRSIEAALQSLVRNYPNAAIRVKLSRVAVDVQAGVPWEMSLFDHELIRQSDLAVLQAANRAGNLTWAMREMADSNRRRLAYRMNVLVQTIFPPVVLCFGSMVLFIVVALFMPLVSLIKSMS